MALVNLFNILQLAASGYAVLRGGAPERIVAVVLVLAAGATAATPVDASSYFSVFYTVLWIDLALFMVLIVVALFADRYWPIWLAALQFLAIAAHGAKGYDQAIVAKAYWLITNKLGYLIVVLLLIGTLRHRMRLAAGMQEPDWSRRDVAHDRATDEAFGRARLGRGVGADSSPHTIDRRAGR